MYLLESPLLADALISKASVLQGYFKLSDLTCRCTKVTLASHQTYNLAWDSPANDWRLEWMALVVTVVILILIYFNYTHQPTILARALHTSYIRISSENTACIYSSEIDYQPLSIYSQTGPTVVASPTPS